MPDYGSKPSSGIFFCSFSENSGFICSSQTVQKQINLLAPNEHKGKGKTMKKLFTQIVKKNGELKDVYVCVDDETAKVLEQVDEETRKMYLQAEWEMKTAENYCRRHEQSLDKSLDNGFDIIDEKQDVEEMAIKQAEKQRVLEAIAKLEPQQQWLVKQIYVYGRKQIEVATELGVGESAIRSRLKKISAKLKKILK